MWMHRATAVVIVAILTPWVLVSTVHSEKADISGDRGSDWVLHAQDSLKRAAMHGPKWGSHRATIERSIQDIGYFLQGTVLAAHATDHTVAAINAQAAIQMLERGVEKGFFRKTDIEPILFRLRPYVSPYAS